MELFKNDEKCFLFHVKNSFLSQDIWIFNLTFLVILEKRLVKKAKIDFRIYDVTTWETNNDNTYIAQYLKK